MPSIDELGEEFILRHMLDPQYDPAKAHEYYLKTRHLKGRHRGALPAPVSKLSSKKIPLQNKKHLKKSPEQHKREIEAKVIALEGRLQLLKKVLAQLVAEAKRRSGIKTPVKKTHATKSTKSNASSTTPAQKLTNQQKVEKAKQEKIAYDKAHPEAKLREVAAQVQEMEHKIAVARAELAAMRKQHTAVSSGAGSNQKRKEKAHA